MNQTDNIPMTPHQSADSSLWVKTFLTFPFTPFSTSGTFFSIKADQKTHTESPERNRGHLSMQSTSPDGNPISKNILCAKTTMVSG